MQARFCAPARTRTALLTTTLLMSGMVLSGQALAQTALPSGGQVIAGTATVNGSGSQTVISQSSDKAIINWTDFSIGKGGEVTFNNGTGATLNRVTGGNLSSIDGLLSATGSVYLINPNGVIIGKTGVVNVGGGFVASALNITNDNFLSGGDQTFSGPSLASVVNLGKIGALGGDVALMAVNVHNNGAIEAASGTAGLLAGHKIIMRDSSVDDGRFLIVTGGADTAVTNDGAIKAASAELRAEGGNIYALAGNTQGVIRATGVTTTGGKVFLTAGTDGSVTVSDSTISASAANGDGGTISVTGGQIRVAADATLDASTASTSGNGGTVNVIADMASGNLTFAGKALARAGSQGGNGGFVETSGAGVDFDGARIDTSAAAGKGGNWLIDPYNLTIDAGAAATISSNLASTGVTLQTTAVDTSGPGTETIGDGDIVIDSAISWSSANTLTLDAYHSIKINAPITISGAGGVVLTTNNGGTGGDYYFALGDSLSFTGSGGSLNINGDAYTLIYTNIDVNLRATDLAGHYALAADIDNTGWTNNGSPVNSLAANSVLTGLGHTVLNLNTWTYIGQAYNGFVGDNHGVVRDIGMAGGTINGGNDVGGLVGVNESDGVVKNAWSSADVTGTGDNIGGLVGSNMGSISNSFATGNAQGTFYIGGLVGLNDGSITNAFATGSATADSVAGGLVGHLAGGTVNNVYATGYASGSNGLFGVVSSNALIGNAYYNTDTNTNDGIGYNDGSYSVTGLTTAQLQGGLPSGFSSSAWATGTGLYPYLKTFSPNGLQAISGTALDGSGGAASAAQLALYANGAQLGNVSSGANGYYYFMTAPGTATSSTELGATLILNGASGVSGLSYTNAASLSGGNVVNFNIKSNLIDLTTGATTYSNLQSRLTATFGSSALSSALAGIADPDYKLTASGAFNFDQALTTGGGLNATAAGGIILSANLTTGGATTFNSAVTLGRDITLISGDALAFRSTINGAHKLTLSGTRLDFGGAVGGTTALTSLNGTATAGDITVGGRITTTGAIRLAANGSFSNTAGATALNAGGGFTVYTQDVYDPTGTMPVNSFGGLTATNYYNDAYDFGTGTFASAVPTGNHFVYAYAASLTPTLSGTASKIYNSTTTAGTTGLTVGGTLLSAGDSVTFSIGNARYDTKNAGTDKTVTADISLSSNPNNYTLDSSTASAAVGTINKATLVASLTGMVEKTYDATTDASLTNANYTLNGVFGGDKVNLSNAASGSYADQDAGTGKTVSVNGLALSGEDAGNYTVNTSAFGAVGVIDKRSVTIAADDIGKISGVNDPLLTWQMTLGSLAGNDTVSGGLSRATGENPGNYAITQGSLAASDNYTVTFIGAKFTIMPAGMQNQPVVNPVQNSFAPSPFFSAFSDISGSGSGSSGGAPEATGPDTNGNSSSSTTCTDGGACANQPYPGNQSFSSYVSFLSH